MNSLHIVTKPEVFVKNETPFRSVRNNLYICLVMNAHKYMLTSLSITAPVRLFVPRRRRP